MSDSHFAVFEAKCATAARLKAEVLPRNKQALFDALAAAGIALVSVEFAGCGDSGQMEQPRAFDQANTACDLPSGSIALTAVEFDTSTTIEQATPIGQAIETLAYELLEEKYDGWENDDGAYGEFRFDVADRTITLEFNERYTATNYHHHEF